MPGFALQGAASHGWSGVLGNTHGRILHLPLNYHTGRGIRMLRMAAQIDSCPPD
jgi:hypothetical protein